MSGSDFSFEGAENLEMMAEAVNYNSRILRWAVEGARDEDVIVDFGAGMGAYCNRLDGYRVYAVEPDRSFHSQIHCPSYERLADIPGTVNRIYTLNVLEHIQDDQQVVRDFFDRLVSGGTVRALVPAYPALFSRMDEQVGHVRRYTPDAFVSLFADAGFRVTRWGHFDCLGYPATLIYKWAGGSGRINRRAVWLYDRLAFPLSTLLDRLSGGRLPGKNLFLEAGRP